MHELLLLYLAILVVCPVISAYRKTLVKYSFDKFNALSLEGLRHVLRSSTCKRCYSCL